MSSIQLLAPELLLHILSIGADDEELAGGGGMKRRYQFLLATSLVWREASQSLLWIKVELIRECQAQAFLSSAGLARFHTAELDLWGTGDPWTRSRIGVQASTAIEVVQKLNGLRHISVGGFNGDNGINFDVCCLPNLVDLKSLTIDRCLVTSCSTITQPLCVLTTLRLVSVDTQRPDLLCALPCSQIRHLLLLGHEASSPEFKKDALRIFTSSASTMAKLQFNSRTVPDVARFFNVCTSLKDLQLTCYPDELYDILNDIQLPLTTLDLTLHSYQDSVESLLATSQTVALSRLSVFKLWSSRRKMESFDGGQRVEALFMRKGVEFRFMLET